MQFRKLPFSPQLVQAAWESGYLPSEDFPRFAEDALESGFDGRCTRRIAGLIRPTTSDLQPFMGGFLQELGVEPKLSRQEAGRALARVVAEAIVTGRISPYEGARFIGYKVGNDLRENDLREKYLPFVGLASAYEDCESYSEHPENTRCELEQEIVDLARDLLASTS
jgi:hypothetical protein